MKTVLLGDIGGQFCVLENMLERIGIGDDLQVPHDIIVIQVGDVVRMMNNDNIDSLACAELVDALLRKNPGKWIQLLGNHESPLIGGPYPDYWVDRKAFTDCHAIVSAWWDERLVKLAAGFELDNGTHVLTHAGITKGYLDHIDLINPRDIVPYINDIVGTDYGIVAKTGIVSFSEPPNLSSDFLWASSSAELLPSWSGHNMGFHQIHGHDTPLLSWEEPQLRYPMDGDWTANIDSERRLMSIRTTEGWTFQTTDWVLKEYLDPDTSKWGLVEVDAVPFF